MFTFNDSCLNNILLFINIVLIIPFVEEIIFKYLLLNGLIDVLKNKTLSIIISSAIFTVVHLQYQGYLLIIIFSFSILISYMYLKFDNLSYPIIIHSINNLISLLIVSYV